MATERVNYEVVLADLRTRRDAHNDAIAAIERILARAQQEWALRLLVDLTGPPDAVKNE